eukprot:364580-Chlamydomonas_euryale.AAC.4
MQPPWLTALRRGSAWPAPRRQAALSTSGPPHAGGAAAGSRPRGLQASGRAGERAGACTAANVRPASAPERQASIGTGTSGQHRHRKPRSRAQARTSMPLSDGHAQATESAGLSATARPRSASTNFSIESHTFPT